MGVYWDHFEDASKEVMKSIVSPATGITAPAITPQAVSKGVFDFTATGQLINFTGLANNLHHEIQMIAA